MLTKIREAKFDPTTPWNGDIFERKQLAAYFCSLIKTATQSMVIGVSAPYGHGKTFFLTRLKEQIKSEGGWVVYVNAWEYDYLDNPLLALLDSLKAAFSELSDKKKYADALKDIVKAAAPAVGKIAAKRAIELAFGDGASAEIGAAVADASKDATGRIFERYLKEQPTRVTLESLRKKIAELISKNIREESEYKTLIIIVDELDRARPNYCIAFMESIKHLFDMSNVIFVVGCDREVFASSARHEFGDQLPIDGYVRRFFDLWLDLPRPDISKYIGQCVGQMRLKEDNQITAADDLDRGLPGYIEFFKLGSLGKSVSLRSIEQLVCQLNVVLRTTPENSYRRAALIGWLQGLSQANPDAFNRYVFGKDLQTRLGALRDLNLQLPEDDLWPWYPIIVWTVGDLRYQIPDPEVLIKMSGGVGDPSRLKGVLTDRMFRGVGARSLAQITAEKLSAAGALFSN